MLFADTRVRFDNPLIRRQTQTGPPLGDEAFVARLETQAGRPLRPQPVGRPRKREEDSQRSHEHNH